MDHHLSGDPPICLQASLVESISFRDRADSRKIADNRDRLEQQLADSFDGLHGLLQKKMALCEQQQQLQSNAVESSSHIPESSKHSQAISSELVLTTALQTALDANVDTLAGSRDIFAAAQKTAAAKCSYEKALAEEERLLDKLESAWQEHTPEASLLLRFTISKLHQLDPSGQRQHTESFMK